MDRTYVTLNIGAHDIRLLSVKGRDVQTWQSAPLAPGIVKDGLVTQPKVVGTIINALFESAGVPKERVIVSLTGLPFTYRILNLPRMKPATQHEAIQRAAKREMQIPLEDLHLSWRTVDSSRHEQDVFVLGVPRKIIEAMVETLKAAGIKPYVMDIKPLALARAANRRDAIIIDLEPDFFDIVLIVNGIPSVMHTVAPKWEGSFDEENMRRLANELSKTVEFHNVSHHKNPLSPTTSLLLTGELSTHVKTKELIQATTGYQVESLIPPFKLPPDLPVALAVTNIGLALKKTPLRPVSKGDSYRFRDSNINLFSGEQADKRSRPKVAGKLLIIALVVGCSLLYPMYHLRTQAASETIGSRAELARVQRELDRRILATKEAKKIQDVIDEVTAQAEKAEREQQNILNRGGEFTDNLKLVTDVLPEKAFFSSVKIGSNQITMEGEADRTATVIDYVIALENTGKFSEVRIAWIDESKTTGTKNAGAQTSGVSFNIVIDK